MHGLLREEAIARREQGWRVRGSGKSEVNFAYCRKTNKGSQYVMAPTKVKQHLDIVVFVTYDKILREN